MENQGRLFGQIAAEAGISKRRAKIALYLSGLAGEGRTLTYAASALRLQPSTIRTYAKDFLIDFSDYRPFARDRDKGVEVSPKLVLHTA